MTPIRKSGDPDFLFSYVFQWILIILEDTATSLTKEMVSLSVGPRHGVENACFHKGFWSRLENPVTPIRKSGDPDFLFSYVFQWILIILEDTATPLTK